MLLEVGDDGQLAYPVYLLSPPKLKKGQWNRDVVQAIRSLAANMKLYLIAVDAEHKLVLENVVHEQQRNPKLGYEVHDINHVPGHPLWIEVQRYPHRNSLGRRKTDRPNDKSG